MLAVTTTTYPIGAAGVLTLEQRTFHGSARGATDATGTTLWPTALPLLMHLQGVVPQLQQRTAGPLRILELGAGCGLLGLGLAATCHADVVMTESGSALDDGETSLSWLERNVELNREICEAGGGHVSCAKLAWGDSDDIAAVRARYAEGFDLVVGSDVLYDSTRFPELWTTVDAFAAANDHGATVDETADLDVIVPHAVGIFGYQIRNGAEVKFGDDDPRWAVVRTPLPRAPLAGDEKKTTPAKGRNPTGKCIAYVVRKASAQPGAESCS